MPFLSRTELSGEEQAPMPSPQLPPTSGTETESAQGLSPQLPTAALTGCPDSAQDRQPSEVCYSSWTCPGWHLPPPGPRRCCLFSSCFHPPPHEIRTLQPTTGNGDKPGHKDHEQWCPGHCYTCKLCCHHILSFFLKSVTFSLSPSIHPSIHPFI